jgi:hypothetical protein
MNTGHRRLPDGCLLRVDIEGGRWVGSLYSSQMAVKTLFIGTGAAVQAWADRICRLAATSPGPARVVAAAGAATAGRPQAHSRQLLN